MSAKGWLSDRESAAVCGTLKLTSLDELAL